MFNFQDKVILVTGAAGNLGGVVARKFLKRQGIVCGLDYKIGRMQNLSDFAKDKGKFYAFDEVDVTNKEQMHSLAEKITDELGSVDILINTVGGFSYGERVFELSSQTWKRLFDLNVHSFLSVTSAFVPDMIERRCGKVITIGAKSALAGGPNSGAYAAAKSALLRLTESMAAEVKGENIQVNCVLPGIIDTPKNREDMPNADFSKWVTPEKVSDVILFLSSSASDAITGAAIPVYGRL